MMHGREKSDPVVVARKRANKAEQSAAEQVERRAGAEGNAFRQSAFRTQRRADASQALERIRQRQRAPCRHIPKVGAVCGKAARTDLCGGRPVMDVPTAIACGSQRRTSIHHAFHGPRQRRRDSARPLAPQRAEGAAHIVTHASDVRRLRPPLRSRGERP